MENQQSLSVYNTILSNTEMEQTLLDTFFSLPRPPSSVSLCTLKAVILVLIK